MAAKIVVKMPGHASAHTLQLYNVGCEFGSMVVCIAAGFFDVCDPI